ncbi:hypothetical protein NHP190012_07830 [Helicobacter sp. NHP19-012]|uniref:Uncharacterized protein n=1 Tax=Helicobacter gastrofelis TaxID=2849642 RepID=A0ABN6I6A2_9HELI|nr:MULTISPECIES: hypothetical protein [unclassified Helicobacter]BCZ19141.1 hypothetical protein NHP190012_07830 [Helicobacter sp. NHP19-012]GMB96641.1 hypothetical protein NHP22001_12300 [Helicobacter sp. NHP22-001]
MNWVDELKIALLENNLERASFLVETCPFLSEPCTDLEALQSAKTLIATTIERLQEQQRALSAQMRQLKAAQKFLEIS